MKNSLPFLEYVFRRAIFGAWMGRDDGHYCDVQSSGVNLFLVEGSKFLFHPLVTYRPIKKNKLAASCQYISSNIHCT